MFQRGFENEFGFIQGLDFDYNFHKANGLEHSTRRDVIQINIGSESLYFPRRRKLKQNTGCVLQS